MEVSDWKKVYKSLSVNSDGNYLSRTATASINSATDVYFDNDAILEHFKRMKFQTLECKQDYKGNRIEIIIDYTRTYATTAYALQEFGKNISTRCLIKKSNTLMEIIKQKSLIAIFKRM